MDDPTISTYDRIAAQFATANWRFDQDDSRVAFARAITGGDSSARYRILDAGCGPGRDCAWFKERDFQVTGVDFSEGMLAEARRRVPDVEFIHADLRQLEFPSGSFDGIWCCASLLHVPRGDVPNVLAAFNRLLGCGWLWLSVKEGAGEALVEGPYEPRLARRFIYFGRHELEACLDRAGFTVRTVDSDPPSGGQPQPWLRVLAQTTLRTPTPSTAAGQQGGSL